MHEKERRRRRLHFCLEEEQEIRGKVTRQKQRVADLWLTSRLYRVSAR